MPKVTPLIVVIAIASLTGGAIHGARADLNKTRFSYKNKKGETESVPVVTSYFSKKIQHPPAKVDRSLDPKMMRAATIAQERANAHSKSLCWRYVKQALVAAGVVKSYPKTAYAKEAGQELVKDFGFKKLPVRDPFKAPVGAVLVYGGNSVAGHVEIRTRDGFVSDFKSRVPSPRRLVGVYAKS